MNTILEQSGCDAVLVFDNGNRRYLTGFDSSFGAVLLTGSEDFFFTDFRYALAAKEAVKGYKIVITKQTELYKSIGGVARAIPGIKTIGIEDAYITLSMNKDLKSELPEFTLKPLEDFFLRLRAVKSAAELDSIRAAQKITEAALEKTLSKIRPGISEKDVDAELTYQMIKMGADGLAFDNIVAFQENTAKCHHVPTLRKLARNEMILIDCGARKNGYCSDMTRTFCLGEPIEQFKELYNCVLGAQKYILSIIRAGYTGKQIDMLCREYFKSFGFDREFGHALGHGVGIQIHELPKLSATSDMELAEGNVVTIEPGLYVDGFGGVRIEDMVLIKKDGIENLTSFKKSINI